MENIGMQANKLINEKSPYLLQHAYNPVNWYPWSEEAFNTSKAENLPIFLSIGYSTCHWCHVMERESFEDDEVAEILNTHFIAIKVDREERPDVDHIYMSVCQGLTGSGGWPLTIIMTPDKKPFFAGTYFPKHAQMGRPGLMEVLNQVAKLWQEDHMRLVEAGEQITRAVKDEIMVTERGELSAHTVEHAFKLLSESFDSQFGGFGRAPKFPTPHNLSFLLRYYKQHNERRALDMVENTLQAMAVGGIYDHIGYGFARYSTDRQWLVPHFEKMLYDNAQITYVLLEAFQVTRKQFYADLAAEVFAYVLRDMTSPEGGFFSAEDADSEGVEGKFYVWTPDEVIAVLGQELGEQVCAFYDITEKGNFEGKSIPNLISSKDRKIPPELNQARAKLLEERDKRIHPHKDDKILTAWNGLMIAALAKGAKVLGQPEYAEAAAEAVQFIETKLTRPDGRLLARYRDGESAYLAYVDDYAFLIWGLLELYEATLNLRYLKYALKLNTDLLKYFWDDQNGGLFMYGSDSEQLLTRPKEVYDGATPSGNSVAILNLLRLSRLTGTPELEAKANQALNAFAGNVKAYPAGYTFLLQGMQFISGPGQEIVIAGDPADPVTLQMLAIVQTEFLPETVLMLHSPELAELVPSVAEQKSPDGKATAYVCRNFACMAPVTDPELLRANITRIYLDA